MKRAIVMGASSGIGHEVAQLLIADGWTVGVAARRIDKLADLQMLLPNVWLLLKLMLLTATPKQTFANLLSA